MSQHVSEDELATLLPDKASTTLQYCADGEKSAKVSSPDDHLSNYVSFHAVSYEVTQRRHCKKVMPKIILNNVRYVPQLASYVTIKYVHTDR